MELSVPSGGIDVTKVELCNPSSESLPLPYILYPFTTLLIAIVISSSNKFLIVLT